MVIVHDDDEQSPLFIASRYGCYDVVDCLLSAGADFNLRNQFEILPLSIESWKKNDKNGDSSSDKLFKKRAGILSGPVALWGLT
jgi:ankyrin repeat protein